MLPSLKTYERRFVTEQLARPDLPKLVRAWLCYEYLMRDIERAHPYMTDVQYDQWMNQLTGNYWEEIKQDYPRDEVIRSIKSCVTSTLPNADRTGR